MTLILVQSPKGGVGSTFMTAQLAIRLAKQGLQVAAIDCTGQDSLKLHFGLRPAQPLGLPGEVVPQALVVLGVALMSGDDLQREITHGTPASLASQFPPERVTIIDVASSDRRLMDALMPLATVHLCVLTPSPAAIATLPLTDPGKPVIELQRTLFILNQLDDRLKLSRDTSKFLGELLGDKLVGSVRRDEAVNQSLAMLQQIGRFAPSSVVLHDLAALTAVIAHRCGFVSDAPDNAPDNALAGAKADALAGTGVPE
ncbi:cellulose synthase operon protein YhjQ/BcsQ [Polymorphobacter multimanifer]|nr:cellulose synthase operon protein YhjQ/BcsQ [Polymorphobacter multimanifer]